MNFCGVNTIPLFSMCFLLLLAPTTQIFNLSCMLHPYAKNMQKCAVACKSMQKGNKVVKSESLHIIRHSTYAESLKIIRHSMLTY